MFNNKKNSVEGRSANGIMPSSTAHSLNSLVEGTVLEGTLNSSTDLRVDGKLIGDIVCGAKVIIGKTGYVEGKVKCQNAVIEGAFQGDIIVHELLNVRESANVSGNVRTDKLIVQSDAIFNVTCQMGKVGQNGIPNKATIEKTVGKSSKQTA